MMTAAKVAACLMAALEYGLLAWAAIVKLAEMLEELETKTEELTQCLTACEEKEGSIENGHEKD